MIPLQQLTIADVLADPIAGSRLAEIPLRAIDFSRTQLGDITALAAILGTEIPLSEIVLPGADSDPLAAWCALLSAPPCQLRRHEPT